MSAGSYLSSRGSGATVLPVSGQEVKYRLPRNRELIQAGLFPLRLSTIELAGDPDEIELAMEQADKSAAKLICASCYAPRIIEGEPRQGRDELSVNDLCPEDFAALAQAIIQLVGKMYGEQPEPVNLGDMDEAEHKMLKALAVSCARFGVDPTAAEDWPSHRIERLLMYAGLVVEQDGE